MHEAGFTEQIVNSIMAELEKVPTRRPKLVKVRVGEMFHLEPESVKMHFQAITKGSLLEGIDIELQEEQVTVCCQNCHKVGHVEDHHFLMCTYCDSTNVVVLSGHEIFTELVEK